MTDATCAPVPCANPECSAAFTPRRGGRPQKYCNQNCAQRHRRAVEAPPRAAKCAWSKCQNMIVVKGGRTFCSGACRQRAFYYRPENLRRYRDMHNELGKARRRNMTPEQRAASYDPDVVRVYFQRRRALKLGADTRRVTRKDIRRLFGRQAGCCFYCGRASRLTIDHLIPLCRGGRDAIGNYVGACGTCNSSKGPLLVMEFRLDRPRVVTSHAKVPAVSGAAPSAQGAAPAEEVLRDLQAAS